MLLGGVGELVIIAGALKVVYKVLDEIGVVDKAKEYLVPFGEKVLEKGGELLSDFGHKATEAISEIYHNGAFQIVKMSAGIVTTAIELHDLYERYVHKENHDHATDNEAGNPEIQEAAVAGAATVGMFGALKLWAKNFFGKSKTTEAEEKVESTKLTASVEKAESPVSDTNTAVAIVETKEEAVKLAVENTQVTASVGEVEAPVADTNTIVAMPKTGENTYIVVMTEKEIYEYYASKFVAAAKAHPERVQEFVNFINSFDKSASFYPQHEHNSACSDDIMVKTPVVAMGLVDGDHDLS